jgi:hypothetical protein
MVTLIRWHYTDSEELVVPLLSLFLPSSFPLPIFVLPRSPCCRQGNLGPASAGSAGWTAERHMNSGELEHAVFHSGFLYDNNE